jgi:hypothetical protein
VGSVTAPEHHSLDEVQRRVALAVEKVSYSWPPPWLRPMLPNKGTEKFVSASPFPTSSSDQPGGCIDRFFSEILIIDDFFCFLVLS